MQLCDEIESDKNYIFAVSSITCHSAHSTSEHHLCALLMCLIVDNMKMVPPRMWNEKEEIHATFDPVTPVVIMKYGAVLLSSA